MHYILLPVVNSMILFALLIGFILSVKKNKLRFAVIISRLFFVVGCILFADATHEGKITTAILETGGIYFEFGLLTMICSGLISAVLHKKEQHNHN